MKIGKSLFILGCVVGACSVALVPALMTSAQAQPRLLPFQGRLTDASGIPVANGAKVVQFRIYDAPTGGTALWNGEVQKLTVNGGLVSTLLGSKADLSAVDFNQALYLEITVDANGDNQITVADPPLLPRQSVLPAVFAVEAQSARDSQKLGGFDWSAIFATGNPATDSIPANRVSFPVGSLPATVIAANNSIAANQLAPDAVDTSEIKDDAVTTAKIKDGTIQQADIVVGYGLVPTGSVVAFAGTTPPNGWLLCDGTAVSRSTYSTLFAAIGNSHGVGDGTATFNLPDYRGRFLRGVNGSASRDPDASSRGTMATGGALGNAVGSVQADAFQGHYHLNKYNLTYSGAGTSGVGWSSNFAENFQERTSSVPFIVDAVSDGAHGTPRVASESRPTNAYVNYIIKN